MQSFSAQNVKLISQATKRLSKFKKALVENALFGGHYPFVIYNIKVFMKSLFEAEMCIFMALSPATFDALNLHFGRPEVCETTYITFTRVVVISKHEVKL